MKQTINTNKPALHLPVTVRDYLSTASESIHTVAEHSHNKIELFLLYQGRILFTIDDTPHYMDSNQMILVREGSRHSISSVTGTPFFFTTIHFDIDLLQADKGNYYHISLYRELAEGSINCQYVIRSNTTFGAHVIQLFTSLAHILRHAPMGYELAVKGYLELILYELVHNASGETVTDISSDFLLVLEYIESNNASNITIDTLAQLCGMSKYYFIRYFNKQTRKTPIEYINHLRIQKACELLKAEDDIRILDIAISTGFQDLSYFNKCFKRDMGITPSQFRDRQRNNTPAAPSRLYAQKEELPIQFYSFTWF